jgi:hypothetical protein
MRIGVTTIGIPLDHFLQRLLAAVVHVRTTVQIRTMSARGSHSRNDRFPQDKIVF